MIPYYDEDGITIYHADCADVLPLVEPSMVALLLTDPPYGMNLDTDYSGFKGWTGKGRVHPPVVGDDKPFDPAPLFRFRRLVLWGANHYASRLPDSGGWLVWNKRGSGAASEIAFGDCELAWTNFGFVSVRMYSYMWHGTARWKSEPVYHPAQKPVSLMKWILDKWTQPGDLILDPYMGSGPIAQACHEMGRRYIGVEIVEDYCKVAVQRLAQGVLAL